MFKTVIIISSSLFLYFLPIKPVTTKIASGEINYYRGNFDDALKEARTNKKLVFIDAYTNWCGWCKKLDRTTFNDTSVINYLNEHFVVIKVNMEAGEGPAIGSRFGVDSYPTLLFLNASGSEISRITGFVNAEEFLKYVKKVNK